jgi:hypothetical protein
MEVVIERVAGLDVHKEIVTAAMRVPGDRGGRIEEIREFSTFTGDLIAREWLAEREVTQVTREATGV